MGQQGGAIEGVTVLFQEVFAYRDESSAPAMYGCLDAITRIPSRRLTQSLLNECMAGMQESDVGFGLLRIRILGLDDFRAKHGPQSVVPFLRTAARTLRHSLDSSNFLGCWDNNEFLAVLPSASPVTVAQTAEMLFNLVSQSEISWWGDRFLVKSEVSYTVATQGNELETLLREMKPAHSSGAVIEIASRTSTVSPKAPAAAVNYSARTQG
jgi:GGDEF domain-containing protein